MRMVMLIFFMTEMILESVAREGSVEGNSFPVEASPVWVSHFHSVLPSAPLIDEEDSEGEYPLLDLFTADSYSEQASSSVTSPMASVTRNSTISDSTTVMGQFPSVPTFVPTISPISYQNLDPPLLHQRFTKNQTDEISPDLPPWRKDDQPILLDQVLSSSPHVIVIAADDWNKFLKEQEDLKILLQDSIIKHVEDQEAMTSLQKQTLEEINHVKTGLSRLKEDLTNPQRSFFQKLWVVVKVGLSSYTSYQLYGTVASISKFFPAFMAPSPWIPFAIAGSAGIHLLAKLS